MAAMVHGVPVALPPPEGYEVDFDNPQRNSVMEAYCLFGVGNFFCLLFMLQRFYVKAVLQRRVQIDDACLFVAYVFSVTVQSLIIRDFARGIMGTHGWEMPLTEFSDFLQALYILPILYNPVQACSKLTLLFLYRRLAPQKWFQVLVYVVGFIVVGSSTAVLFTTIFPCKPLNAAWDPTVEEYHCVDRPAVYKATAALGAITDFMVLAVPIPIIVPLQMGLKQKIGIICVFSIGIATVFTSVMRLVALIRSMGTADQSWGGGPVLLWILVESNLSCICGTLPTLKPFLNHISPRILGTSGVGSRQPPYLSGSKALITFGGGSSQSKPKHDKYNRFGDNDPMFLLETIADVEGSRRLSLDKCSHGGRDESSVDGHGDGDSGKGIMQTRTATASASDRE